MAEPTKHQKEVLDFDESKVIWHSLGSGKTLTSLLKAKKQIEETGRPALFIVPAPLVDNIHKERIKHKVDIPDDMIKVLSYQKASKLTEEDIQKMNPSTVVVDEAHRARNPGKASGIVRKAMATVDGIALPMTATLNFNSYHDMIPIVNSVARGPVLPSDPREFDRRYIKEVVVEPSFIDKHIHGVTPGIKYELKNTKELAGILNRYIHRYVAPKDDFPEEEHETVNVVMSQRQQELYAAVMGKLPSNLRRKIESGLPPDKQELSKLMNFLTGPRMISTSTGSFETDLDSVDSTKLDESLKRLLRAKSEDKNFKALVYSNFIGSGIDPAVKRMRDAGLRVGVYTGATSYKEKKKLREDMNHGDLDVLSVSSSGSEGLDLQGVKYIHVLDPHFNKQKIRQVIGRGVRYKSHEHLPEEERKVKVTHFISTLPDKQRLLGLLQPEHQISAEEYLRNLSDEKDDMQQRIDQLVKRANEIVTIKREPEPAMDTVARYSTNGMIGMAPVAMGGSAIYASIANKLGGKPYGPLGVAGKATLIAAPIVAAAGAAGAGLGLLRAIYGPQSYNDSTVS